MTNLLQLLRRCLAIFLNLAVLLVSERTEAVTNSIACTYPAITNALATANEGDTVLIGPGSCIISNLIVVNRNVSFTIAGSGTNQTTLIGSPGGNTIWVYSNSTNTFTTRDLNLVCVPETFNASFLTLGVFNSPGLYHVYNVQMTNVVGRGITIGFNEAYGCIDHCTFKASTVTNITSANHSLYQQCIDFEGGDGFPGDINSWTNSNPIGTLRVQCVEDCYFWTTTNGNGGNGFFDSYKGAQVLFRHNYCDGYSPIGGHGYDSQASGIRTWEIYNNIFTNSMGGNNFIVLRGGSGVVASNQFWGNGGMCVQVYYRATPLLFTNLATRTGMPNQGTPGQGYIVNFAGSPQHGGVDSCFTNQPQNGDYLVLGNSFYYFYSNLTSSTAAVGVFGGASIKIGATVAQTITNFYNGVNLTAGSSGPGYTNAATPFEFIAVGCDPTNLYLTNALDCNTNQFGYPAYQQPGVINDAFMLTSGQGTNFIQHATKWPAWCYGNTMNGVPQNDMLLGAPGTYLTNLVLLGRDFFTNTVPSTNVYMPLVYPHPLANTNVYYTLTVNQGTGSGNYVAGQVVNISTNASGFTHWDANPRISNTNSPTPTYTMTNAADAVTAFYNVTPGVSTNVPTIHFQSWTQ